MKANMYKFCLCVAISFAAVPRVSYAYEIETHAKLTNEAFSQSQLSSDQLQKRLGIDGWLFKQPGAPLSVGDLSQFLDVSGDRILSRNYLGYEANIITVRLKQNKDLLKLNGWMMSGVIREDDTASITGAIIGGPPNEPGVLRANRFCNHFFDPVNIRSFDNADPSPSRGFSGFCFGQRVKDAPQWALGSDRASTSGEH